jgi:hypothetical protein
MCLGFSSVVGIAVPLCAVLIPGQFFLAWFNLWAPVEKSLIRRRLKAQGITDSQLDSGLYAWVSDPTRSSLRKFTVVEDDVGMLWFGPDSLAYRGDADGWDIPRSAVIGMVRKVDKGSMSAYAGAVHIILQWRDAAGTERHTRLHVENCWSLTVVARRLDALWRRLEQWRQAGGETASVGTEAAGQADTAATPQERLAGRGG